MQKIKPNNLSDKKKYIGIFYFILSLSIGCTNDFIMKSLSYRGIPYWNILFFRYASSIIFILPFVYSKNNLTIKSKFLMVNIFRGIILVLAMYLWNFGISKVPLLTSTIMGLFVPLISVFLANFFLKERITIKTYFSLSICFIGSYIALGQNNQNETIYVYLIFLFAAFLFAFLDISYKEYSNMGDSFVTTLFYSSLVPSIISFVFFCRFNFAIDLKLILECVILGIGNNAIIFFILKAYRYASVTEIAPYRYSDFFIASLFDYLFFAKTPPTRVIFAAVFIISCNLLLKTILPILFKKKI